MIGRELVVATRAGRAISISLPSESSVGQARGDLVVYTRHGATGSEVRGINLVDGCDVLLARPAEIVRSAVLSPDARAIYVHSVKKAGRADAGVVHHDLASGAIRTVVPPLPPNDAIGPIFGTQLSFSIDARALAVQSCGFGACVTRVLDVAGGTVSTYAAAGQGGLIALTSRHLVTYAACPGIPCAVQSTDLASGATSPLAGETFAATFSPLGDGTGRFNFKTAAGIVEVTQ